MQYAHFNAVLKGQIGDGSHRDLVEWLEKYINILFPDNGIEYWYDMSYGGPRDIKVFQPLPRADGSLQGIDHFASYVRPGNNEGRIIEVKFCLIDTSMKRLTFAKSFGSAEECWKIAHAISEVLDPIFTWNQVPELVAMADKLPRRYRGDHKTNLTEAVVVTYTSHSIHVSTKSGVVFDSRDWSSDGDHAKWSVMPRVKDWEIVLQSLQADFTLVDNTGVMPPIDAAVHISSAELG